MNVQGAASQGPVHCACLPLRHAHVIAENRQCVQLPEVAVPWSPCRAGIAGMTIEERIAHEAAEYRQHLQATAYDASPVPFKSSPSVSAEDEEQPGGGVSGGGNDEVHSKKGAMMRTVSDMADDEEDHPRVGAGEQ